MQYHVAKSTSWFRCFSYIEEDHPQHIDGLRPPQLGAIHAAHMHWATANSDATIVMPTGTGKTETMLSILLSGCCERILVVVPTDALRMQLAEKFATLGVLKRFGVASDAALYPIVGMLKRLPRTTDEVDALFARCNVIVTTAQIAGRCREDVQLRMAHHCPYLFIDEAHHIGAPTWQAFKRNFSTRRILQFTATPYRNDGKLVEGKIIFNYPLGKALEEKYFLPIRFEPVVEFDERRADAEIAARAVAQLRADCEQYDHILMARVDSIQRARDVHAIYAQYAEFSPVQIHTGMSDPEQARVRRMILARETRIIVCVDMLGEGFDLPELKIAAFHDVKKSLAVTIQLAGRFTRGRADLGQPTVIANVGDVQVQGAIEKLYTQDADWTALLPPISAGIIDEQISLQEFLDGFRNFPDDIPLRNLRPALSTALYHTRCEEWHPERFRDGLRGHEGFERLHHDINHQERTLVIVTAKREAIIWAHQEEIHNWDWELFVLHWDEAQKLLFINSSSNGGYYQELARAVAGDVELITGPPVFRAFAQITRLQLQNVGLAEQLGRLIRYVMRAGSDVETGLTEAQRQNARKSNISGTGYEDGEKVSVGCSYRGRIWSHRRGNVRSLVQWCEHIGRKVLDEGVDPDQVLSGTLTPTPTGVRPSTMPIGIEWPEEFYTEPETAHHFVIDDADEVPRYLADLQLTNAAETGDITFALQTADTSVLLRLTLWESGGMKDYRYSIESGRTAMIRHGRALTPLAEYFYQHPPTIWFVDGASLEGNSLTVLKRNLAPYPADRIHVWEWAGIDIRKESQGLEPALDSIQYRVIQRLKEDDYTVIFDDDDAGESADVVAIRVAERSIMAELYHCKYAHGDRPGARISDLYEVCGQAQKSVHWMDNPAELFRHLLRRESKRVGQGLRSRFERGSQVDLLTIASKSRSVPIELAVYIVQPGLARSGASVAQLQLLSVTENYLMETYKIHFAAIASA